MLLHRLQSSIVLREFLSLAASQSFDDMSSQEVLQLVKSFNQCAVLEIKAKPSFGEKRFESAVLKVWELSRSMSKRSNIDSNGWKQVMATCNAVYEGITFLRKYNNKKVA